MIKMRRLNFQPRQFLVSRFVSIISWPDLIIEYENAPDRTLF